MAKNHKWQGYQISVPFSVKAAIDQLENETFRDSWGGQTRVIRNIILDWLNHYEADPNFLDKSRWYEREARGYAKPDVEEPTTEVTNEV